MAYATTIKGYVLSIYALSFDKQIVDQFERNIQQLHFFDAAKAQEEAGPDSYPYQGLPIPSTSESGNQNVKANAESPSQQPVAEPKQVNVCFRADR